MGKEEEVKKVSIGMALSGLWATGKDDRRLDTKWRKEQLPSPVADEEMLPFWRPLNPGKAQLRIFEDGEKYFFPKIIIQHLCGYNYTPENYIEQAERLERFGFECLRSRRDDNERFWEMWCLFGLFSAEGELKEFLDEKETKFSKFMDFKDTELLKSAIEFLCETVSFGALDIAIQRAAMPNPD